MPVDSISDEDIWKALGGNRCRMPEPCKVCALVIADSRAILRLAAERIETNLRARAAAHRIGVMSADFAVAEIRRVLTGGGE